MKKLLFILLCFISFFATAQKFDGCDLKHLAKAIVSEDDSWSGPLYYMKNEDLKYLAKAIVSEDDSWSGPLYYIKCD